MKKVAFITLGCKVNTYETEGMKRIFEQGGYEVVEPENLADLYHKHLHVNPPERQKIPGRFSKARRMNRKLSCCRRLHAQVAPEEVSPSKV